MSIPLPLREDLKSLWMLDQRIAFLNHGSFGATPARVFDQQTAWRRRMEAEPVERLARRLDEELHAAKHAVGGFLGMELNDFGFVSNATEGVNAVLRSLPWKAGDEIVTTSHVYGAVRQAMKNVARVAGVTTREIDIPIPAASAEAVARAVINGISARTRLLIIDHITSPTALIFPVEQIVKACAARGVDVLIDGAHAPGMLPLNVSQIGAAYYVGNLHKWVCAPKGSAFLWTRGDRQHDIHPLVISHHYGLGFAREFDWQGTRDFSAIMATPDAIAFMQTLGWERIREFNHAMIVWAGQMLCQRWGVEPVSPPNGTMLGSMVTVPLPGRLAKLTCDELPIVQQRLYDKHAVEAPLMVWNGRGFVRPCCQVYNVPDDYERLASALWAMRDG